jgi:hypothetical protein
VRAGKIAKLYIPCLAGPTARCSRPNLNLLFFLGYLGRFVPSRIFSRFFRRPVRAGKIAKLDAPHLAARAACCSRPNLNLLFFPGYVELIIPSHIFSRFFRRPVRTGNIAKALTAAFLCLCLALLPFIIHSPSLFIAYISWHFLALCSRM